MEPEDLLRHVRDVCEALGVAYLVTGSIATIAYGEPRFTNDLDIVIDLPPDKIADFCESFPGDDYYVSLDAVQQAVQQKFQFNVIHPASGLKIDFIVMSDSEFDHSRRARRRLLPVLADAPAWFASPEDVILKKMLYYQEGGSDKHLRDIAGVLRVQGNHLDRSYIEHWAAMLEVGDVWHMIESSERDT